MKPLIVANWKCNPTDLVEAKHIVKVVRMGIRNIRDVEVVICPPFIYLSKELNFGKKIKLGAQNCFWKKKGAFTGEVSVLMIKDIGCQYVIVGHSERRRYFGETDEIINEKIKSVISANMSPILCIGETEKEKREGKTQDVLERQIRSGLKGVSNRKFQLVSLSIAYEPIWAIGSGKPCNIDIVQTIELLIRKILSRIYNNHLAQRARILYGGSVNSRNAQGFIKNIGINGLLIGGASLKPNEFLKIIKEVRNIQ